MPITTPMARPATLEPVSVPARYRWVRLASLIALWALAFLPRVGRLAIFDFSDAMYAEVPREMLTRGDWITPYANALRYLEKPPLYYWLIATGYRAFGVSALTARFVSGLVCLGLVLVTYFLGELLFDPAAGWVAGATMATSAGYYIFAQQLMPDPLLTLLIALAFYSFLRGERSQPSHRATFWQLSAFACIGLSVLAKGLIGLVFPVVTIGAYALLRRRAGRPIRIPLGRGLLVFAVIALPWHLLVGLRNPGWAWFYLVNEHILRFLNRRVPRDYTTVPLVSFWLLNLVWLFPWSVFLPLALRDLWRACWSEGGPGASGGREEPRKGERRFDAKARNGRKRESLFDANARNGRKREIRQDGKLGIGRLSLWSLSFSRFRPFRAFASRDFALSSDFVDGLVFVGLWAASVLVFFSFSTRLEYYTMPAYPALALLIGAAASRQSRREARKPVPRLLTIPFAGLMLAGAGMVVAAAALAVWSAHHPGGPVRPVVNPDSPSDAFFFGSVTNLTLERLRGLVGPALGVALPAFIAAVICFGLVRRGRVSLVPPLLAAAMLPCLLSLHRCIEAFQSDISSEWLAAAIRPLWRPGDPIVIDGEYETCNSMSFYARQPLCILDGRRGYLEYGSRYPDAPSLFLDDGAFERRLVELRGQRLFLVTRRPERFLQHRPAPLLRRAQGGKSLLEFGD